MFTHLLKMLWNKRRANGLIFLEILLSFFVLFGVFAFFTYNLDRYRSPLGMESEDRVGIRVDLPDGLDSLAAMELQERIKQDLLAIPAVRNASWLGPVNPFGYSNWNSHIQNDTMSIRTMMMFADHDYAQTLAIPMTEGRWFTPADYGGKYQPVVVNKAFKDDLFPDREGLVGLKFDMNGISWEIVGVTGDFKYLSNFAENEPLTFFPQIHMMAGKDKEPFEMMILELAPNSLGATEETIYNQLVQATKSTDVVIWDMEKDRRKANRSTVIPIVILLIISGFLLVNIALGLFGVLFTQIGRRRAEIGLRKALGASAGEVTTQFILELLIVAGSALLLGTFFAIQVPLLELTPLPGRYFYLGIVGAVITVLVLVVVCSLIPSRQAAGLHPALVLHED